MKKIEAIIQPHLLHRVMQALQGLRHFPGVTVSDCQGQSRGRGAGGHYEATTDSVFFKKVTKLELFCSDTEAAELVDAIRRAAHTGNPGDGLIAVADLSYVVRVRTGQEQDAAV
jgi:nitrogen regulatory protein P-II 1